MRMSNPPVEVSALERWRIVSLARCAPVTVRGHVHESVAEFPSRRAQVASGKKEGGLDRWVRTRAGSPPALQCAGGGLPVSTGNAGGDRDLHEEVRRVQHHLH